MTGKKGKARADQIIPSDIPSYVVEKLRQDNMAIDRVRQLLESLRLENSQRIDNITKAQKEKLEGDK